MKLNSFCRKEFVKQSESPARQPVSADRQLGSLVSEREEMPGVKMRSLFDKFGDIVTTYYINLIIIIIIIKY